MGCLERVQEQRNDRRKSRETGRHRALSFKPLPFTTPPSPLASSCRPHWHPNPTSSERWAVSGAGQGTPEYFLSSAPLCKAAADPGTCSPRTRRQPPVPPCRRDSPGAGRHLPVLPIPPLPSRAQAPASHSQSFRPMGFTGDAVCPRVQRAESCRGCRGLGGQGWATSAPSW